MRMSGSHVPPPASAAAATSAVPVGEMCWRREACKNILLCFDLKNKRATPIPTMVRRSTDEYPTGGTSDTEVLPIVLQGSLSFICWGRMRCFGC